MKNNLFVIGDSFCRECTYIKPTLNENRCFWAGDLSKRLDVNLICDGEPSRDVQTIIDNWIKIISLVTPNDYLVICIPYFKRTRLPLSEKNYQVFENSVVKYVNRFIGTPSYNNLYSDIETFGNQYDWKKYENDLKTQEIINASMANQLNSIEVIESLYNLTKGKKYIFSWDTMDFKSQIIEDREILTKNIGMWETHKDVYIQTNGKHGSDFDTHWSFKMNRLFSEYLYIKFSNE